VPAPSACMTMQWEGLWVSRSGMILQKAEGKRPRSREEIASCTSCLVAETPRDKYLSADSDMECGAVRGECRM
jgi:hypothetical protein